LLCSFSTLLHADTFVVDYEYFPKQDNLKRYDFSILSPYSRADLTEGHAAGKKFYAYISASEVAKSAQYFDAAENAGIPFLTENPNWDSMVVDLASPRWAPFVVQQLAAPAVAQGYDGFFLDTMDSYYLAPQNTWTTQEAGLVNMVRALKTAYPTKKIIINRGFPVFSRLKDVISGMLVEGLYYSYPGVPQERSGTQWLLGQLAPVHDAGVPVYILDYMAQAPSLAPQVATQIAAHGFWPLIVARELDGTVLASAPVNSNKPAPEISPEPEPEPEIVVPPPPPSLTPVTFVLRVQRLPLRDNYPTLRFKAKKGYVYTLEATADKKSGIWTAVDQVAAEPTARNVELRDSTSPGVATRVYRLLRTHYR
jgi:uncharacterized protein (TIGR01370 family)